MEVRPDRILLCFAGVVIALAMGWTYLAHPALDDFCLANAPSSLANNWNNWTGRWAASLTFGALFAGSTFPLYWLPLLAGLVLWWSGFVIALKDRFLGTVAFALLIAGMPSQAEGLFWYTDVITYTVPFFLGAVALRAPWPVAIVAAFLVSGFSELCGAFVLALSLIRRAWRVAIAAALGLAVYLAAPGNAVRAEHFSPSLLQAAHTFRNYDAVLAWIADPRILLFVIYLSSEKREGNWRTLPILAALVALAFAGMTFMLGGAPPARVLNVFYALILIGWILTPLPWTSELPERARQALALALGIALVTSPNVGAMIRDLPDALRGDHAAPLLDRGEEIPWVAKCLAKPGLHQGA